MPRVELGKSRHHSPQPFHGSRTWIHLCEKARLRNRPNIMVIVLMEEFLISSKNPLRSCSAESGLADISLDACPRAYSKELLASFPDCAEALKNRPSHKLLLFLAVHKTSMSMASFSPDTGAPLWPARDPPAHAPAEAERECIFRKHLDM